MDEPNINWKDNVQNLPVKDDDDILDYRSGLTSSIALTKSRETDPERDEPWNPTAPEVITINPLRMKQYKIFKPDFNEERIKKAIDPKLKGTLKLLAPMFVFRRKYTPIDLLDTPALTMFHEVSIWKTLMQLCIICTDGIR